MIAHGATATLWVLLAVGAAAAGEQSGSPTGPAAGQAFIAQCQVFLIDDVPVPAREAGVLVVMPLREGQQIRRGQLVGQIDDRQAQYQKLAAELQRDAAVAKAADDIEVRYAQASFGVAEAELSQNEEINRRSPGSVSSAELRRLKLTRQRAQLQIDRSRLELKVAGMSADVEQAAVASAEDSIERRKIVAPFDGTVVEVLHQESEWVDVGQPVVRIIRLDRLRVEGFLDAHQFNPEEVLGRAATIEIERARGQKVRLPGKVVFVSPLVQAGNKYRIRAEVQNQVQNNHWLLGPGMVAAMTIHVAPETTTAPYEEKNRRISNKE